jgi:hypothetical protein
MAATWSLMLAGPERGAARAPGGGGELRGDITDTVDA